MNTTTQTKPHQPTCLEPAHWSKDEHRKIDEISEALSTLPESILSVIETAFLTFESGLPWEVEQERPDLVREARKVLVAAQVARCL
mgnify:FL=1